MKDLRVILSIVLFTIGLLSGVALETLCIVWGIADILQMVKSDAVTFGSLVWVAVVVALRGLAGLVLILGAWFLAAFIWPKNECKRFGRKNLVAIKS